MIIRLPKTLSGQQHQMTDSPDQPRGQYIVTDTFTPFEDGKLFSKCRKYLNDRYKGPFEDFDEDCVPKGLERCGVVVV